MSEPPDPTARSAAGSATGTAIETVEMHTGGEPVRIVTAGYPAVEGATILDKRRYAAARLDRLRHLLIFEPRGHHDMYGVIPVAPDHPDADLAVLFMHNEGYSTMCGHAVIALGRWAVDSGQVAPAGDPTTVRIQCPCGLVTARVALRGDANGAARTGEVAFESVPAFALALDRTVEVAGHGSVSLDIGYGGAFYAVLPAARFGLDVLASPTRDLVDATAAVTRAVADQVPIDHPGDPDLGFLYGTILTDGPNDGSHGADRARPSANICVFAGAQVDRSPTGSGVTARIALMRARGTIAPGEAAYFESVTRSIFRGRALAETTVGPHDAVTVEVTGHAHYTGTARFTVEPDDLLAGGFLLK